MNEPTICLGVMAAKDIAFECVESLFNVIIDQTAASMVLHRAGPYLDDGRNRLITKYYEIGGNCDRLLMVDSDIEFTPQDIRMLAEHDLPVVSGVYLGSFEKGILPVVYEWIEEDGEPNMCIFEEWPDGSLLDEYTDDPLLQVDGVGAGFLMIKREVLDQLWDTYGQPLPWFAEHVLHGKHWGEDLTFCHRLADNGIPVYIDRRVRVGHHKPMKLTL